jgi:hypothetical protein
MCEMFDYLMNKDQSDNYRMEIVQSEAFATRRCFFV